MRESRIAAVGTSVPPFVLNQKTADQLLTKYYESELRPRTIEVMHKILDHPSIVKRHVAVESLDDLVGLKNEDPDGRMERFTRWAVRLAGEAITRALKKADVSPTEVSALVVNTCTGYICPGISTYLIESLGLASSCRAYDIVGMGCGGAVPNIDLACSLARDDPEGVVLSVSVEVCSATYQMGNDMSLVVSNAIFGDGAAAAVVWARPTGPRVVDHRAYYDPACRDDVRYVYHQGQLHNRLSQRLPQIIGSIVPDQINAILESAGLRLEDIDQWAIHPGGHKMLEHIKETLGLPEKHMQVSRAVLREYGNMSSPSVLFALDTILSNGVEPGRWCLMVGYGAGLSVYTSLLQT